MTTSKVKNQATAFVWVFLPEKTIPIVAGCITKEKNLYCFNYGQSYLQNPDAIPLSPFELPLQRGKFFPEGMNIIHSCLRDASPDAWGRRLIDYQYADQSVDELGYLLFSGSNRIGALDFQRLSTEYEPRESKSTTLEELLEMASYIELGKPVPSELEYALLRGTSVGGARPKALIQSGGKECIAKFGSSQDKYNIIKAEYIGMRLAKHVLIDVPEVNLSHVLRKDILLIERFDRKNINSGTTRRPMLSGLSLLKLNEIEGRYASYIDLADVIRQYFDEPKRQLLELYKRLIFNILIGNTDDHARNHSAFWNGKILELTPAYDLCPQLRTGQEATQAMVIQGSQGNFSTLLNALSVCEHFQVTPIQARKIIEEMIDVIQKNWKKVCEEANLSEVDHQKLWKRSIFNPFCFQGW